MSYTKKSSRVELYPNFKSTFHLNKLHANYKIYMGVSWCILVNNWKPLSEQIHLHAFLRFCLYQPQLHHEWRCYNTIKNVLRIYFLKYFQFIRLFYSYLVFKPTIKWHFEKVQDELLMPIFNNLDVITTNLDRFLFFLSKHCAAVSTCFLDIKTPPHMYLNWNIANIKSSTDLILCWYQF